MLQQNFYVDYLLKSVKDVQTAIRLFYDIIRLCASGGFKLTKIISNKEEALQSVTEIERRKGVKNVDLNNGNDLPTERALGVKWNIENDQLCFTVNLGDKPFTRHGMLSMISIIFDRLGLAVPFLLKGKIILQDLCKSNYSWDDIVPSNFIKDWESWKGQLHLLEDVVMMTSQDDYGQVSYLQLVDEKESIHCCLVMGKSKVAPTKFVSIPRLEISLSVKVSILLRKELTINPIRI